MRGRTPSGPEFVDKLNGSAKAKERAKVLLETLAGTCRIGEACERLGIKDARFDQIRLEGLQALVAAMEDKPGGRPARARSEADLENQSLRDEVARLQAELEAALVRAELAITLPRAGNEASKKTEPELSTLDIPNQETVVSHMRHLLTGQPVDEGPLRRGPSGQLDRREDEQVVRRHAVLVAQHLFDQGWTHTAASHLLDIPLRTLDHCRGAFSFAGLAAAPLGRPAQVAPPAQRNLVIGRIDECGPGIGVPSLRREFPGHARGELADLLRRYRDVWQYKNRQQLRQLHWSCPGAVWAVDFHGPRRLIDGCCPYLLAIRDLASGQVPSWLPTPDATAAATVAALEPLFIEHGAPLVLKSDNGSAFIAAPLRQLCQKFSVKILYSPPRTPSYNGSIEATIGSLKIRTEQHAAADNRPGAWTSADAQAARSDANGPLVNHLWATRRRLEPRQRHSFLADATRRYEQLVAATETPKDDAQLRAMDRQAISQALVELGYLSITRGRFRLPVVKKFLAKIS